MGFLYPIHSADAELSFNKYITPYPKAKAVPTSENGPIALNYLATPNLN
jgi:hypothetical protein